eukprot:1159782-Pelagomonas_calceolata.AAC.1
MFPRPALTRRKLQGRPEQRCSVQHKRHMRWISAHLSVRLPRHSWHKRRRSRVCPNPLMDSSQNL